jgi:hypothetical protein
MTQVMPYAQFPSPDSTPRANAKLQRSDESGSKYSPMMSPFMMQMMMPMAMPMQARGEPMSPKQPSETPKEPDSPTMVVSLNQLLESSGHSTNGTITNRSSSSSNLVGMWHGAIGNFPNAEMRNAQMQMQSCATTPRVANKSQKLRQPHVVKPRVNGKKQDVVKKPETHSTEMTLMMRGIPCSFTQEELMKLMDEAGLKGKYNFFYLPYDSKKSKAATANLGYAFINFVDQQSADHCASSFTGVPLNPFRSPKTCRVSPADIQGLNKLWEHFRNKAVSASGSRGPMFLEV